MQLSVEPTMQTNKFTFNFRYQSTQRVFNDKVNYSHSFGMANKLEISSRDRIFKFHWPFPLQTCRILIKEKLWALTLNEKFRSSQKCLLRIINFFLTISNTFYSTAAHSVLYRIYYPTGWPSTWSSWTLRDDPKFGTFHFIYRTKICSDHL